MEFFGREKEIAELRRIRSLSHKYAKFTVITGRRRIGKTELVKRALNDGEDLFIYLLIRRLSEKTLCESLQQDIESSGITTLGRAERFSDLVRLIAKAAQERPVTLVIDEFQEFDKINPAVFGEMQGIWDDCQHSSKLNLIVCGSVNRLMNRIFFNKEQPLYGRNTGHLKLKPFGAALLKEILRHHKPGCSKDDLWSLWTITGGVARYVQLLMDANACSRKRMIAEILSESSSFIDEGKTILAEEFGAEYSVFFSILTEIASGRNTFGDLVNAIGLDLGTYLARLENDYGLISRIVPIYDREKSRNTHYTLEDPFLRFWFRFLYKYRSWIEMDRKDALKELILRDFDTFAGFSLERYFRWKFVGDASYTRIGGWWDRKGENEIDLVCEDELTKAIDIYEVKSDRSRYNPTLLKAKIAALTEKHPMVKDRLRNIAVLSLQDM